MSKPKTPAQLENEIAAVVGPGPRPKDPREISFAPECFIEVGQRVEYVVLPNKGSTSHPEHFATREKAETRGRRLNRRVIALSTPIMKRVRWK